MASLTTNNRASRLSRTSILPEVVEYTTKLLPNIYVPTERALTSGHHQSNIDAMNSVIRAVRNSIHDRCFMAGSYPTFLLEKMANFSEIDFHLISNRQLDEYGFYRNFCQCIAEKLDPNKNWKFELWSKVIFPPGPQMKVIPISEQSILSFMGNVKNEECSSKLHTIKLKVDRVNIANFCFSFKEMEEPETLKENIINNLLPITGEDYAQVIYNSYDTYLLMNVAHFTGPDNNELDCCDISGKKDIDKIDKKGKPVFKTKNEGSECKYITRLSGFLTNIKRIYKTL